METQEVTSLPVNWMEADTVEYDTGVESCYVHVDPDATGGGCQTVAGGSTNGSSVTNIIPWDPWDYGVQYNYPYYHYWPNWKETVKIRLTMSDVEKLRAAAKKDKTLKKVLQKIGPHIEVEVDF